MAEARFFRCCAQTAGALGDVSLASDRVPFRITHVKDSSIQGWLATQCSLLRLIASTSNSHPYTTFSGIGGMQGLRRKSAARSQTQPAAELTHFERREAFDCRLRSACVPQQETKRVEEML